MRGNPARVVVRERSSMPHDHSPNFSEPSSTRGGCNLTDTAGSIARHRRVLVCSRDGSIQELCNTMGVLSDIIIADKIDAAAINAAGGAHLKRWPCLESKGIDTIKLGTLYQILHNRSLDDMDFFGKFMQDAVLDQRSNDGPWVFLVPEDLKSALAALDDAGAESVTEKWAATEEFESDGWQFDDVEEYFQSLVVHARKARDAGKSLLLWMSL